MYILIVVCAPLSTNAFMGCPLTSTGILRNSAFALFHTAKEDSLEHGNAPEHLGRVLECVLEVFEDGLLLDRLLNLALRLDAEGVRFEEHAFALGLELGFVLPLARLADELRKLRGIVLGGVR